ncbi:hypothetical protein LZ32DRAFT_647279 [Colletotrichum eremochloae]|nr:hypothetical protein LZ32DRAFT_647279 [Colletotrichum eremochloae]
MEHLANTMDVQVNNEELDGPAKIGEADVPVNRGERDVQVKAEEEEVYALPTRSSVQMPCALSLGAPRTLSQTQRSSSSLLMQQANARPDKLAVHNNATAITASITPANLVGRQASANSSLPAPSSAPKLDIKTNVPPPRGSGARQSAPTKLQSVTAESKSVFKHQPVSRSGLNLTLDALVVPLSTLPSQPNKHIQNKRNPVSPMKTTKFMTGPVQPGVAVPFCKETRAGLNNEPHDDWIYTTSTGSIRKLPPMDSCGSWEISLPSKLDTAIHIDPYIDRLSRLLNVKIESTKSPPSIHVKLFESQFAEQAKHSYLLEEHTAMKWKAWAVLAAWADHLIRRSAPPAIPPIDLVSFVRNRFLTEGRHAKATAVDLLHERQVAMLLPEGHGTWQMPRLTPADLVPLSKPPPPGVQQPSLMPTKRLPQASKSEHKHLLSDDYSSSSSSDSSPEVQTKRLRRKS